MITKEDKMKLKLILVVSFEPFHTRVWGATRCRLPNNA